MQDTLWITLPVETWRKLFSLARQANRNASDYLRTLIDREAQKQATDEESPSENRSQERSKSP